MPLMARTRTNFQFNMEQHKMRFYEFFLYIYIVQKPVMLKITFAITHANLLRCDDTLAQ